MSIDKINLEYQDFLMGTTGEIINEKEYRIVYYPFENYSVTVIVDSDNKFIGIAEIKEKRDFLSNNQRIAMRSFLDIRDENKE
jgi:hypothetical protein